MTITTSDEYAQQGGAHCPVCDETNLEGESFDLDGSTVTQEVHCTNCMAEWVDVYELTGYHNLKKGGGS